MSYNMKNTTYASHIYLMHIRSGKAIFVLLFRKVRVRESLSRLLTKDSSRDV